MNFNNNEQNTMNEELIKSCKNGDLEKVRYLLTYPNISVHADIHATILEENGSEEIMIHLPEEPLFQAAKNGHLPIVQYLLTSNEIKDHATLNIYNRFDSPLFAACQHNHIDIVKYLLTSSELSQHAHTHNAFDNALNRAVRFGRFDIIKYLLTTPELKNKVTISNINKEISYIKIPYTEKQDGSTHLLDYISCGTSSAFLESIFFGNLDIIKFLLEQEELQNSKTIFNQKRENRNIISIIHSLLDREGEFFKEKTYQKTVKICQFLVYDYGAKNKEYQDFLLSSYIIRSTLDMFKINDIFPKKSAIKINKTKI